MASWRSSSARSPCRGRNTWNTAALSRVFRVARRGNYGNRRVPGSWHTWNTRNTGSEPWALAVGGDRRSVDHSGCVGISDAPPVRLAENAAPVTVLSGRVARSVGPCPVGIAMRCARGVPPSVTMSSRALMPLAAILGPISGSPSQASTGASARPARCGRRKSALSAAPRPCLSASCWHAGGRGGRR